MPGTKHTIFLKNTADLFESMHRISKILDDTVSKDSIECIVLKREFVDVTYQKLYVKNLPLTPLWIPRLRYVSIEPH